MNGDLSIYRLRRSSREKRVMIADGTEPIRKQHREPWWSTDCEKNFLDHLGSFTLISKLGRLTVEDMRERKRFLLLKYRDSIFKRKIWDTIDQKQILAYVEALIKNG